MSRPIDGDKLIASLKANRLCILFGCENDGATIFDKIVEWIQFEPTLTLPNEKLTCNGCIHEYDKHENCNYCQRAPFLSDYYYHYSLKE